MATKETTVDLETGDAPENKKKGKLGLFIALGGVLVLVGGGGAAAYLFVPGLSDKVHELTAHEGPPPPPPLPTGPIFAELPEMSVTLPNAGQARQLRIRISLELKPTATPQTAEVPVAQGL